MKGTADTLAPIAVKILFLKKKDCNRKREKLLKNSVTFTFTKNYPEFNEKKYKYKIGLKKLFLHLYLPHSIRKFLVNALSAS